MSRTSSSSTSFSLKMRIALIGSPTYFGFENFCVFTSPPSCSSRHGMTRCLSTLQAEKVSHHGHSEPMALLGMELHAVDVPVGKGGRERVPVVSGRQHILLIRALGVKRVCEVEALLFAIRHDQGVRLPYIDGIPANVGHA